MLFSLDLVCFVVVLRILLPAMFYVSRNEENFFSKLFGGETPFRKIKL